MKKGNKMKVLRIIFTVLCALCLAALPIVGIFWDLEFIVIPLLGAGVFFLLMLFCRKKHMEAEEKQNPTPPQADFFNPASKDSSNSSDGGQE